MISKTWAVRNVDGRAAVPVQAAQRHHGHDIEGKAGHALLPLSGEPEPAQGALQEEPPQ